MTLVSVGGNHIFWPHTPWQRPKTSTETLDAAGDAVGWVITVPEDGTFTEVAFGTSTHTTTATLSCKLMQVSLTSGQPTTTIYAANASGSVSVDTADKTYSISINGGTGVTVTKGDFLAICLYVASGTPNFLVYDGWGLGNGSVVKRWDFPYAVVVTDGSCTDPESGSPAWGNASNENPGGAYKIDSTWYPVSQHDGALAGAVGGGSNDDWSSSSDPDGRAQVVRFPFACRITGFWRGGGDNSGATYTLTLRDTSGTQLLTTGTLDEDATRNSDFEQIYYATDTYEAAADTDYYVVIQATNTTTMRLYYWEGSTTDHVNASPSRLAAMHAATWDSGTPGTFNAVGAVDDARVYPLGVIIDQIHDGAGGGGGGVKMAGASGGMVG